MPMRIGCFLSVAVFCLLVSGMKWDGGEAARAAVIRVTPANVQASIDKLPESTPESAKPRSLQAIVADSDTYVGDEDAVEFAAGTYDDVGELLLTRPLTLRKDPAAEGDAVITGELLIQIRSKDVKVEDLTFRDLELGDATILRDGESNKHLNGPHDFYFGDVTLQSFLLDRKAKASAWQASNGCSSNPGSCTASCPSDGSLPDCKHDYSSYTGQLHETELGKHLVAGDAGNYEFFSQKFLSDKETGVPKTYVGSGSSFSTATDRWDISGHDQPWLRNSFAGHILINPRWNAPSSGPAPSCPAAEAFTGIEITRNSFDGTEVGAVYLIAEGDWAMARQAKSCAVDIKVVGNTFRNIGVADFVYLTARDENGLPRTDSAGNPVFIMDENGNRIPNNNEDETAVHLQSTARKVTISDNAIEGTSFGTLRFRGGVAENAEITISNNLIRAFTSGGNQYEDSLVHIDGAKEDTKITISGNRLFVSDSNPVYTTVLYDGFFRRAKWCNNADDPAVITDSTTIAQLDRFLRPVIAQSYVPSFPYPPLDGSDNVVDADDGTTRGPARATPVRLAELAKTSATVGDFNYNHADGDDGILKSPDIMIFKSDIVLYKGCKRRIGIFLEGHENTKISLVDNDIGYGDGAALIDNAIELWGVGGDPAPGFEAFSGNNIDNYVKNLVGGTFAGSLATRGNYIGSRPRVSRSVTLNRTGELSEPAAREQGTVGPRAGMTADSPPMVPRIRSAAVSPSGRNMIVLTYGTALDGESEPTAGAFTVRYRIEEGRTGIIGVDDVEVDGSTVILTLEKEIPSGASGLTVVYSSEDAGDSAVRSTLGGLDARDDEAVVSDSDGGDMMPMPTDPGEGTAPKGDGGCVLASSGSGGAGLGVLLTVAVMGLVSVLRGRKRK